MNRKQMYSFLNCMTGIDNKRLREMLLRTGDIEVLFEWPEDRLLDLGIPLTFQELEAFRKNRNPAFLENLWTYMTEKGISYVSAEDEEYPSRLFDVEDRPFGLFYRGKLPDETQKSVSIIGARRCTTYGKEMAHFFGQQLAKAGVNVISGMALGIDGYAGRGALSANGASFAVLGGGCDICYPVENVDLYRNLLEQGGILSERPPGYVGRPYDFPVRNRIISGLCDALIVIEAAENSGSLITVNDAIEQNREIFALPGRVGDRMSKGCNDLIKNGAQILLYPEDVLQYLGISVSKDTSVRNKVFLSKEEQMVFREIGSSEISVDELLEKTNLPLSVLLERLVLLEVKGLIRKKGLSGYILTY